MTNDQVEHYCHRVLLVEHDPEIMDELRDLVHQLGYEVLTASSTDSALEIIRQEAPCLVLASRLRFCRLLKKDPRTAPIPVIVVAGKDEPLDLGRDSQAEVADYITNPRNRTEVALRIQTQIQLHETQLQRKAAEERLCIISSAVQEAIIIIDGRNRISHWNEAAVAMFGYSQEEALGRNMDMLIAKERLFDRNNSAFPRFQRAGHGDKIGNILELIAVRKNGEEFPIELSLSSTELVSRWRTVGIIREISERQSLERQLSQAQKLEAVGQLAAGIAHEINTPTQFVGDSVFFLREAFEDQQGLIVKYQEALGTLDEQDEHQTLLEEVREAEEDADLEYLEENVPSSFDRCTEGLSRIASIVGAMKEFAHPDQRDQSSTDINQALEATLTIAKNEYKYVADAETDLAQLPPVMCYAGELNQVFLNLLVNAAHAIKDVVGDSGERGKIRVRTQYEAPDVRIEIEDTGCGIPEEIHERIFDPFYTTKEVGKGSGQGLAIARSIVVDKHHGTMTFASQENQGTTFIIRLPVAGKSIEGRHGR